MTPPVIGVFDSGVGGLTVLRELLKILPGAQYLYFGDTARLPYGSKSAKTVARYALSSARFLQERGAQALVLACNTATALAIESLQESLPFPVIGVIEPGAERAAEVSLNRKVAVIATEATVSSHAYQRALAARGVESREKACPLFVPLVEEGWTDNRITEQVAQVYLEDLFSASPSDPSADVLLLGCTHYPLLRPLLERVLPASVNIVDSAQATAQAVRAQISHADGLPHPAVPDGPIFFATDSVEKFRRLGERFLGRPIAAVELVNLES